jgi:hypothetical protein
VLIHSERRRRLNIHFAKWILPLPKYLHPLTFTNHI